MTLSLSAFVPKPHTPFQWERQIGRQEIEERVAIVRKEVGRDRNVDVKFHSPEVSVLEGIFSRGDARLSAALLRAYRLGARFDAWTESFRPETWRQAFAEEGIDGPAYLGERDPAGPLPWDFVDAGVDRAFLLDEREKARTGETTPDCRADGCSACGACPPGLANITYSALAETGETTPGGATGTTGAPAVPQALSVRHLVRIQYAKQGPSRFLSGLEIQSLWGRALRRAGLPVAYSQGFNPAPRLSFSPALPVGTASLSEFVEAEFFLPVTLAEIERKVPPALPDGVAVVSVRHLPPGGGRLSDFDLSCTYRIDALPPFRFPDEATPDRAERAWQALRAAEAFSVAVEREDGRQAIDLKPMVVKFMMNANALFITIIHGTGKGVRPLDAASALLGAALPPDRFALTKISAELAPRRKK